MNEDQGSPVNEIRELESGSAELLGAEEPDALSGAGVWPDGTCSIISFAAGVSRAKPLLPALTPRRFAGRSKVHGTSKSEQFWHRPSGSSLWLHLMLRLLQKSPKRQCCQPHLRGSAKHEAKWSKPSSQLETGKGKLTGFGDALQLSRFLRHSPRAHVNTMSRLS